jgi:preprotein translocase subunit SecE
MSAQRRTATRPDGSAASTPPRRPAAPAARPAAPSPRPPLPTAAAGERPARPPAPAGGKTAQPTTGVAARTEGLRRLYRDTVAEMKKVNWPDRETTKNLTLVVIGISAVLGVLLGGIDFLLQSLFEVLP